MLTAVGRQAFGLVSGPVWFATLVLGVAMLVFDFGAVLYAINYLALRQAITPDRLMGRMTATMRLRRWLQRRWARSRRRAGDRDRTAQYAADCRRAGARAHRRRRAVVAGAAAPDAARGSG
jgi:hypothetical protein